MFFFSSRRRHTRCSRDWSSDVCSSDLVAILSEKTAREVWPNEDAIGKRIQLGGRHEDRPWAEIVGIVGDVHQYGLDSPTTPQAYLLYSHHPFLRPCLVIRSGEIGRAHV